GGGPAARLHLGAELTLAGTLALRSGLDGGRLAAGTGLLWQGFSVDSVYEQRDLGATQRIGVSKAIGPTVSASREAVRVEQERDLARRLEQAYEGRRREQVSGFLARVEAARADGRFDEAMEAVTMARALGPEDPRVKALEATLQRDEGERLERAGDPAGAAAAYARVLEASPGDSLAAAGRQRVQLALSRLAERSRHAGDLGEAYRLFGAGDLAAAREAFRRVNTAAPGDSESATMLRRIDATLEQRLASRLARARRDLADGLLD